MKYDTHSVTCTEKTHHLLVAVNGAFYQYSDWVLVAIYSSLFQLLYLMASLRE